ncbi:mesoderm induction early response protein 1 isoform X2 [Orussus abietinus]|uniref:mesoderm induction early response protein 1 isoform X2 n=1 Tax=Orussus abietinus TaxID=222816 RepID=UPI000C715C63|nr:mesoderm induction early response protein 1 isoform X2 [Orussus abietinus]
MADRDYEVGPATEMMVNDFDDERTLDEEEALEGSEDSHNELSNLQKEGDMPLKELLAMYGYGDPSTENSNSSDRMVLPPNKDIEGDAHLSDKGDDMDDDDDGDTDTMIHEPDLKQFYTEMVEREKSENASRGLRSIDTDSCGSGIRRGSTGENGCGRSSGSGDGYGGGSGRDGSATGEGTGGNDGNGNSDRAGEDTGGGDDGILRGGGNGGNNGDANGGSGGSGGSSRLLRSVSRPQSEEEEDDCDYSPDEEEWKKTIMVGSDYQAAIPEGLCRYDDALPYENEDKMLWDPSHIPEEETEEFLERAQLPAVKGSSLPSGSHIRDDEQALYLLLQCGYNLEEALRRRRMNVIPPTDAVSLWSEEECHNFETGLRSYGKDFHLIQKNKVRTRSVGELVQFYYLWKKTERHDIFTFKARLEKKKYALHPGITDYMDRFLEEQEGVRDRSSSPSIHCLLYGDAKRQRTGPSIANSEETKLLDSWEGGPGGGGGAAGAVDPLADLNGASQPASANSVPPTGPTHHHLNYPPQITRESPAEDGALWTSTHGHPNNNHHHHHHLHHHHHHHHHNHAVGATPAPGAPIDDSPSPENILPHLPP